MNDKRGQTLMITILVAFMVFVITTVFLNFIKVDITTARGAAALDCSNTAISDGNKLLCLIVDGVVPYFFIACVSVAIGLVTERFVVG